MLKQFRSILIILILVTMVLPTATQAQDDGVTVLICEDGQGCYHAQTSGTMPREDAEIVVGEDAPYEKDNVLVCDNAQGCYWSGTNAAETDEAYGGTGEPADMHFDPEDVDEDIEGAEGGIIPNDMSEWTIHYKQGTMDCNFMNQTIPASAPHPARIEFLDEDGSTILLTSSNSDLADLEMTRTETGAYHGEVVVEGQTVNWDVHFLSTERLVGNSYTTMISEGVECDIQRYFWGVGKQSEEQEQPESEEEQPEPENESEELHS